MFRRLASMVQGSSEPFEGSHLEYLQEQDKYFKTIPHLIPSAVSGLPNFDKAIQTADISSNQVQKNPIEYPNDIFRAVPSPDLANVAYACTVSSLDELMASKNPTEKVGCGWLYTPPDANSPYPKLSKGFLGKMDGPTKAFDPPAYKQWFFDLQAAKRQVLLDKCKALKACTDVDSEVFKGHCGFCTHTNQGVPIDQTGQPLYPSDPRGGCDSEALIRSAGQCPPPPPPPPGPTPLVDRTCDPVNGRIGAECIRRQVLAAGCNERGSLALALSGSPSPMDYMGSLRDSAAMKMYQRTAQPPLNMDVFTQGKATTQQVLQEARQLVAQTTKSESSGLGLAARDLCLRRGTFERYDECSEISDAQSPPYPLNCLQQLFLKMGGTASGRMYPTVKTHNVYNSFGTWGEVKQYLQKMYRSMYANTAGGALKGIEGFLATQGGSAGDKYVEQRQAMIDFLGIVPEKAIQRIPYQQGVEVFWFVPGDPRWNEGKPPKIRGFLRRTVERDIVQIQPDFSRVAQIGGPCAAMVQLVDIRAQEQAAVKFQVNVDDGFWIAVNQPHSVDRKAIDQVNADEPGLFENNWYQGATWYQSKACTSFSPSTPNITKLFFQDSGCGGNSFLVNTISCSGTNPFQKPLYSMTLEERAPFLTFEVSQETGKLEELRLPAMFEQFSNLQGTLTPYLRKDDRLLVPGQKAFLRMNSANSLVDLYNIAFQSWKSVTFAIRFQSMPVKETMIGFAMGQPGTLYYNIVATPSAGNRITLSVEHFFGGKDTITPLRVALGLNQWYQFTIHNRGTGFDLFVNDVQVTVQTKGKGGGVGQLKLDHTSKLFSTNGTWHPKSGSGQPMEACTILVGTRGYVGKWKSFYASSACEYDLAWIHFFDYFITSDDVYRDCMGNWQYTQFPVANGKFQTLGE